MMRVLIATIACLILSANNAVQTQRLAPNVRLNNGYEMPVVGLGTFESTASDCERAVKAAIDSGYRHIDSAFLYGNEVEVGNAVRAKIAEGVIKREDIFITTKLWSTFHEPSHVAKAFQRSFDNLNVGYIDLYLIHYPVAYQRIVSNLRLPADDVNAINLFPVDENGKTLTEDVDYVDTWKAMEELVKSGRVRSIGVSNFNSQQVERVNSIATIKPVTNQVECHPNLNQRKLIEFCAARNITVTAYSPLGRPHTAGGRKLAIGDPAVLDLAQKYNKSPAQIILRYSIQNGVIVIPKSTHKIRIQENINIFDFQLTDSEMQTLHGLNNNYRILEFTSDKESKYYPFNIEF